MKLHIPHYLGGGEVELEGELLSKEERIVGWIDEYGTITSSKVNQHIGDIVSCKDSDWSVLVLKTPPGELYG